MQQPKVCTATSKKIYCNIKKTSTATSKNNVATTANISKHY
jgi:hypothetical protein